MKARARLHLGAAASSAAAAACVVGACAAPPPSIAKPSSAPPAVSAPSPPIDPIEGEPVLIPQRIVEGAGSMTPATGGIMVLDDRDTWTVIDLETGVVRGTLAGTSNRYSTASPDGRFFAFVGLGDARPIHVWDLSRDTVRVLALGLEAPRIDFAQVGTRFTVTDERHAFIVDAATGFVSEPPLPAGWIASKATLGDGGDGIVEAANGEGRSGLFWVTGGVARSYELPQYMWGYTIRRDRVLVYGSTGVMLLDLRSSAVVKSADPCGDTATTGAWFSKSERFIVLQCQPPIEGPKFVVVDGALEGRRELLDDPMREVLDVEIGLNHVMFSKATAIESVDLGTGDRTTLALPSERLVERGQHHLDDAGRIRSINDEHAALGRRVNVFVGASEATAHVLRVGARAMDTRTRTVLQASGVSRDGDVILTHTTDDQRLTMTVTNRASGDAWTIDAPRDAYVELSPSGDYALALLGDLWLHSKRVTRKLGRGGALAMSDRSVATVVFDDPGQNGCRSPDGCRDIRVDDVATGASRRLGAPNVVTIAFSPKGDRLLVNDTAAWDPVTGKVVWMIESTERVAGFTTGTDLAVVIDDAPSERPTVVRLLDVATGAERRKIADVETVRGTSGRFVLLGCRGRTLLLDTSGFTTREVFVDPTGAFVVSEDGAFIWFEHDGYVVAYRVADQRELQWLVDLPPFTDELVFDPADADKVPLMVRNGPNVLAGPMTAVSTVADRFGHPNLVDDFFAGKPVSPVARAVPSAPRGT